MFNLNYSSNTTRNERKTGTHVNFVQKKKKTKRKRKEKQDFASFLSKWKPFHTRFLFVQLENIERMKENIAIDNF